MGVCTKSGTNMMSPWKERDTRLPKECHPKLKTEQVKTSILISSKVRSMSGCCSYSLGETDSSSLKKNPQSSEVESIKHNIKAEV